MHIHYSSFGSVYIVAVVFLCVFLVPVTKCGGQSERGGPPEGAHGEPHRTGLSALQCLLSTKFPQRVRNSALLREA